MPAPPKVLDLVRFFDRNSDEYRAPAFNEANLRIQFINPMFKALGWDMENEQGHAEAYKDVIHEANLKIGEASKAPDYCFRIGGTPKFYLEAKKPFVNIKDDPEPAFQLRRYAWSAKLPLSILTDFEEFAVYDGRVRPSQDDKASTARILYLRYTDYAGRWDEIADVFAREAILRGSFDKYAETKKAKRGTATVDDAFLEEIEGWREDLAKNFAARNPKLSSRELNFAVQITIDRIIFLRMCEDRGIEPYGQLRDLIDVRDIYGGLFSLFRQADDRYNSGLFHFENERGRPEGHDELTPKLKVDDKVLKGILKHLYYPDSPYEFSVLPVEILGQVYEQFLGKVIRLTAGHNAKVEEKPEVKKAGGVYYTPGYIVEYIVKHTVGKLLEGKTPKEASKLRILDPACGSGSFLLGAYQYLLDWHLAQYQADEPDSRSKELFRDARGTWRLTTSEKKRILLSNIYGVDIDPQAVEVTKLSLLLKVLEGETQESINQQRSLFHGERVLPDLAGNIKCGNSLIGPDFYDEPTQGDLFEDEEERLRINVFDWNEQFGDIMSVRGRGGQAGFDAVVGNPPYGMITSEAQKPYFQRVYRTTEGRFDNFELFIEKGIALCRPHGMLGYIVPSPLLSNLYARRLRAYLLEHTAIREITNFGMDVFSDPTIHTCIVVLETGLTRNHEVQIRKQVSSIAELGADYDYRIPQSRLGDNPNRTFDVFIDPHIGDMLARISSKSVALGTICHIRQCIKTGDDEKYVRSSDSAPRGQWKATLRGRSIGRYCSFERNLYLLYGPWLARNWANKSFYETPKIAVRETGNRVVATEDLENRYFLSSLYAVYPKVAEEPLELRFLLGILNSALATFFVKKVAFDLTKGAFTKIRTNQLARLPIPVIDRANPVAVSRYTRVVDLVGRMLLLQGRVIAVRTPHDQASLQSQIAATDRQIDRLVYELYGLTDDEIKTVEGTATSEDADTG